VRVPAGVVVGIVPFNFPLNLGMHKVAPALAVGAPIIIKPPPQAPTPLCLLAQWALEAGADRAALQVLPCDDTLAERLATDARVRIVSFTGSARVGWHLKRVCDAQVVLELGGNAAAIVADDADVARAVPKLVAGAFGHAGQVCIKAQRIIVQAPVWDDFCARFVDAAARAPRGDPALADTVIGPVIDDRSADRMDAWVREGVTAGARVLFYAPRTGRVLGPIVLSDVPPSTTLYRDEVFGPVVLLERATDFDDALRRANDSQYGLQAAVFTNELSRVRRAFAELDVGGVIVNDAPSFRSDNMPYGGMKRSGLGREGVRAAMHDFTEPKVLVLRD